MAGITAQPEVITDEKVFYKVANTYIKLGKRTSKEEVISGSLFILEKCDGCHIEWRPSVTDSIEEERGERESWAVVNAGAIGYTNNQSMELMECQENGTAKGPIFSRSKLDGFHNHINFSVSDLKSFKRMKRSVRQHSCVIFILDCGTTHHPIFFQKGGTDKFITQMEKKAIVTQSFKDNDLFLVSTHQAEAVALQTSFDALNLFEDKGSALQRFVANPVRGTLGAFAKVSSILSDALIHDTQSTMRPEFCDQLRTSIDDSESNLPTVNSSQPEDPDFLFVDEKAQLPAVAHKPRGRPLNRDTWERSRDANGKLKDPEHIQEIVFKGGISHELRRDVWKFLLSFYPWNSTDMERDELRRQRVDEYFAMKLQWKSMSEPQKTRLSDFKEKESLIAKDVNRTDRTTPFFEGENNEKLQQLNDILMTYVMHNFNLGYVQGMSDLLSPILLVMDNEVDAFWCFVGYMNLVETNFEMDQQGMKLQLNQLNQLVQIVDRRLYNYLDAQDSSNMYFAFRWLLILFKREFSMDNIMRLWEILWTGMPCKNYQLVIATSLLIKSKNIIIENDFSFTEILKHINDLSGEIDLAELLISSEALAEQLLACENLPSYVGKIIGKVSPDHDCSLSPYEIVEPIARSESPSTPDKVPPPRPATSPAHKGDA